MIRYETDGTATLLANEGTTGPHVRVGERWAGYPQAGLTAAVRRTGQAARVDDYRDIPGGEPYLREGLRSAVALPIHVNGRLWGAIAVGSGEGPLPDGTEHRMTEFTDLVATAVANAQNRAALEASRDELSRLLAEQAALRRVATLVARGTDPGEVFSAVAEEVRRLVDADSAGIGSYEPDGTAVVISGAGDEDLVAWPAGRRLELRDYLAPAVVWRTRRPARVERERVEQGVGPGRRRPARAGHPVGGGQPDRRRRPPVGHGGRADEAGAVSFRHRGPDGGLHRAGRDGGRERPEPGGAGRLAGPHRRRHRRDPAADRAGPARRDPAAAGLARPGAAPGPGHGAAGLAGLAGLETEIGRVAGQLDEAVEDLREIARGIHPAILSEGGLGPALRTLARRAAIAVELDVPAIGRLPEPVEVAAYYAVSEALTNATRHAHASVAGVSAEVSGGALRVCVRDDGTGGADPLGGSGLVGLKDRIEALGGTFAIHSPADAGTTVSCELPVVTGAGQPDTGPSPSPSAER